jgi:hypothetical protein
MPQPLGVGQSTGADGSAANLPVSGGTQANLNTASAKTTGPLESNPANPPILPQSNEPASNQLPIRSVNLRVEGQSGEAVNVRLTDRAGQVQVSVSSSDSRTAASLQQDLATLAGNLDKIGWKAEQQSAPTLSPKNSDGSADQQSRQQSQRQAPGEDEQQSGRRRPSLIERWAEVADQQNG